MTVQKQSTKKVYNVSHTHPSSVGAITVYLTDSSNGKTLIPKSFDMGDQKSIETYLNSNGYSILTT